MEIVDLWFRCKNADCGLVPLKTKKDKIKYWREGKSITESARQRLFMRAVEGYRLYRKDGELVLFVCKYGTIILYNSDAETFAEMNNHYHNPIENKEMCNPCLQKIENEKRLML